MLYTNSNLYCVTCFVLIIFIGGTISAYGTPSSPSTFLKGSKPYGVPYEDWMTKWWQWNIQIPKEQHPQLLGSAIKICPVGESGNVSFLTQSLQGNTEYSCTIQAGHAIMIPILTGECTTEEAESSVPADMMKCATEGNKYSTFDVTVDGVRLNGLDQNDARSKVFNMTLPEDSDLLPSGMNPTTYVQQDNLVQNWKSTNWSGVCSQLPNISKPTLVTTGTEDFTILAANSLIIAGKIPGAWLVQIPAAGHPVMDQYPAAVSKILNTFLSTTAQSS